MQRAAFFIWLALAGAAGADEPEVRPFDPANLARSLPQKLLDSLAAAPESFVERTAGLIASYGGEQGLTAEGIDWKIASDRAKARARAVERLSQADLDDDGAISEEELDRQISLASEGQRGRLEVAFRLADTDANGTVGAGELADYADRAALRSLSEASAVTLQATMMFDLDGDGLVVLDEVVAAVAALRDGDLRQVRKEI